jgi:hypothetical protein
MKTQFTPGPWHLGYNKHDASIHNGVTIASVCDDATHWKANAHLIASAPDLLASLVELESMVAEMLPKHGPCGWGELALNQARQAIAKATGNNA